MTFEQRKVLAEKFFIIGCGSIGKRHINNLKSLLGKADIIAFDTEPERREEVACQYYVQVVETLEEGWRHSPKIVFVTTPTSQHVSVALEAARRGCHLFIEKPLSNLWDHNLEELLNEVRKKKLITLVGCNLRFHPGLKKVKQLLEDNTIGRVVAARVEVGQYLPDWRPWEDYRQSYSAKKSLGGGIILDAIHEIDYIRWMFGEITSVYCLSGKISHLEIEAEDTAAILLRFANGTIGEVHLDCVQRIYSRSCQIIGDEGTIRWDFTLNEVCWYTKATGQWHTTTNPNNQNQMYLDELKHLLHCLGGESKPALDVFDAAQVLKIALAAKASSVSGQKIEF